MTPQPEIEFVEYRDGHCSLNVGGVDVGLFRDFRFEGTAESIVSVTVTLFPSKLVVHKSD